MRRRTPLTGRPTGRLNLGFWLQLWETFHRFMKTWSETLELEFLFTFPPHHTPPPLPPHPPPPPPHLSARSERVLRQIGCRLIDLTPEESCQRGSLLPTPDSSPPAGALHSQ